MQRNMRGLSQAHILISPLLFGDFKGFFLLLQIEFEMYQINSLNCPMPWRN